MNREINTSNKQEAEEEVTGSIDALTIDTAPNRLTAIRMLAVPVVVWCLAQRTLEWDFAATVVFIAAAITDYFDGYIARTTKSITVYGKLLDPLADKFLVVVVLIMLQHLGRIHPGLVMILICREMTISSLRALASAEGVIIAASQGGKWKAALQMVAIPFLMVHEPLMGVIPMHKIGLVLISLSVVLSLGSLGAYALDFFRELHRRKRAKKPRN